MRQCLVFSFTDGGSDSIFKQKPLDFEPWRFLTVYQKRGVDAARHQTFMITTNKMSTAELRRGMTKNGSERMQKENMQL